MQHRPPDGPPHRDDGLESAHRAAGQVDRGPPTLSPALSSSGLADPHSVSDRRRLATQGNSCRASSLRHRRPISTMNIIA